MTYFNFDLSTSLMLLLLLIIFLGFLYVINLILNSKYKKKKGALQNSSACRKALSKHKRRLYTDYFWSNHMRAAWIMLFLLFFIALGFALDSTTTIIISLILSFITLLFLLFAIRSYRNFPSKAAEKLKTFEEQVENAIKKEISFDGDNIQSFSKDDDAFDTNPKIFSFPVGVTKIAFPPFEKDAKKHPIISTRKLEFLILSREYFSICKGAATFNLLNPAREGVPKQCAEKAGSGGECHEHYYSQMRNVEYDDKKECIRIIYNHDEDSVEFPCKKAAPNRKPAMKALKEKLRLTERQKLQKINEHEKYEEIMERRKERVEIEKIESEE